MVLPALFHVMDLSFALGGGFAELSALQVGVTALHLGLIGLVWWRGLQERVSYPCAALPP